MKQQRLALVALWDGNYRLMRLPSQRACETESSCPQVTMSFTFYGMYNIYFSPVLLFPVPRDDNSHAIFNYSTTVQSQTKIHIAIRRMYMCDFCHRFH